jgi:small subunit ribosomal protein S6
MVIFDTGTEPPAIQAVVDRLLETVRTSGGTPGAVDRWGRRPFAYEVKHRREGYYVLAEFSGEVQTVNDLDRMLSLADEVLRHKVIRLPEKALKRVGSGTSGGKGSRGAPPPPPPLPERPSPEAAEAPAEPEAATEPEPAPVAAESAEGPAEEEVVAETPAEGEAPADAESASDLAEA